MVSLIRVQIHKLKKKGFMTTLCWIPSHIGIKGNELADRTARESINLINTIEILPMEDWVLQTKERIFNK